MPLFINKVMLAGNLTRNVDTRHFADGKAVANFGLAINRRYKGRDGEQKEEVTFVDVTCFGRTAELCDQYLSKGRNVHIEGRLKLDQWDDRDGNKRSNLTVTADQVNFIDSGKGQGQQRPPAQDPGSGPAVPPPADLGDDDPPF